MNTQQLPEWEHRFEDIAIDWSGHHYEKTVLKQFIAQELKTLEARVREEERSIVIGHLYQIVQDFDDDASGYLMDEVETMYESLSQEKVVSHDKQKIQGAEKKAMDDKFKEGMKDVLKLVKGMYEK